MRNSTIKDIAIHVGVSTATVSAVMSKNCNGNVRVSEATRTRILEAASLLNYRPNSIAQSLRRKKTNVIGLYSVHGYLNPEMAFTTRIVGGLHRGCNLHGKDLLLHGLFAGRSIEEVYNELANGLVDGLILYAPSGDPLVERLARSSFPVVGIVDALPGIPSVVADDEEGMRLIAQFLKEKGVKKSLFRSSSGHLVSSERRNRAFIQEAERLKLEVVDSIFPTHEAPTDAEIDRLCGSSSNRPDAVVCWNDQTAYFILKACLKRGMQIPGDLAITGFDGLPPTLPTSTRVTTVNAPWIDIASKAVDLLMLRIQGEDIPMETKLAVSIEEGDTT